MTDNEQNLVDCCMDSFDFEKTHKVIEFLEWGWYSTDGVPSLFEVKQFARKLFRRAIKESDKKLERYDTATGGFHITIYREEGLVVFAEIKFEVATSEYDVAWLGE